MIVIGTNSLFSIVGGFATFSIVGNVAFNEGLPVEEVVTRSGTGLAFVTIVSSWLFCMIKKCAATVYHYVATLFLLFVAFLETVMLNADFGWKHVSQLVVPF